MKKTIFNYDSSDEDNQIEIRPNSRDLYAIGNSILSHKTVDKIYKNLKINIGYNYDPQHSKSITQYLTKKSYTKGVLNAGRVSLTDTLWQRLGNSGDFTSLQEKITKINGLYQTLETIQTSYKTSRGKINTENFLCFKKLKEFLGKPNDLIAQDALREVFGIESSKKKLFFSEVQKIVSIKDNIDSLSDIINTYPIIRVNVFIKTDNDLKAESALIKNDSPIFQDIKIVTQVKNVYQQLKDIQVSYKSSKGKINTENFLCFKKLKEFLDKPNDPIAQDALGEVFGIESSKKKTFFSEVQKIVGIKDSVNDLFTILSSALLTYNTKLLQILVDNTPLDTTFLLDTNNNNILDYDEYAHRNKVKQEINQIKFFEKSDPTSPPDASKFLAASLFYQKLLKTLAKTLKITVFPKKINGEYSLSITDINKQEIKIAHEFTTGLSRKDKIVSLGNYQDISKQLVTVGEKLSKSDKELVQSLKKLYKVNFYRKIASQIRLQ